MTASATDFRCESDLVLFERLLAHPTIRRANEQLERLEERGETSSVRRRLLATSVRISETMAPDLHATAAECGAALGLDIELELYVFASPTYNAMCFKPEDGRLFVMFASSLLEAFDDAEIRFVMAHELAHHVYHHHDVPIGYVLAGRERPDPRLALDLFTWSRYAEISADRAGGHCAGDLLPVSSALFKLASGLTGRRIRFNLPDFLAQVDAMQVETPAAAQRATSEDWFSTHPFSPLRVRALKLFFDSELAGGKLSRAELEHGVTGLMSLMEPSYLDGRTETAEAMRRLLFAGALVLANADGHVSEEEIHVFEQFFGNRSFTADLDIDKLTSDLENRIASVRAQASQPQAMQVLRDLCLIARAGGQADERQETILEEIAVGLGLTREFVCQAMRSSLEPD
ncbi:MAG: M48 family metallopeptidase [Pseudomonadales bacterium]